MLHRYGFSNFQSFRDRVDVDLTLTHKVALTDWMADLAGGRVSKVLAVIGPNGGGKTALLKPMAFLGWFVSQSFAQTADARIPVIPHFASKTDPTEFECLLDFDGSHWRYVLRCTEEKVLHEALYQKGERFRYVFVRDWDPQTDSYRVKQQDFGLAAQEARKVRRNVSLIAWAAQFDVPLARRMAAPYVVTNINVLGRVPMGEAAVLEAAQHFLLRPEQRGWMSALLSAWDLGLADVDLREMSAGNAQDPAQKIWVPYGRHRSGATLFELPFAFESSGTQAAFVLLARVLEALAMGGLAVIDELENDLHPHMVEPILGLFANPQTNRLGAQILFTCHSPEVLTLLNKAQVMVVEKNEECESLAIRLDKVAGIRSDDNLYAKYMAGAYGGVPRFDG